jgi:uncharacterized membrane protein
MANESQDEINESECRLLYNWFGPFGTYSSRADTRLWVPKRQGSGYTLNFAQPGAKAALGAMFIGPIVVITTLVVLLLFR